MKDHRKVNREILRVLTEEVEKYPSLRFEQLLVNLLRTEKIGYYNSSESTMVNVWEGAIRLEKELGGDN